MKINALLLICLIVLSILSGCASLLNNDERSVNELANAGFYVYAFPDKYENQNHWKKIIKLSSFDSQCADFFSNDNWNPIYIDYTDDQKDAFEIRISPQDAIWDKNVTASTIPLEATWIPTQKGEYYSSGNGGTIIKIKDKYAMDVIISSYLSPQMLADIITHLEYHGANPVLGTNPWKDNCRK